MSIGWHWFTVFKSSIYLLIFCLIGLSVIESGVLKFPAIIQKVSISPLHSVSFSLMYFGVFL